MAGDDDAVGVIAQLILRLPREEVADAAALRMAHFALSRHGMRQKEAASSRPYLRIDRQTAEDTQHPGAHRLRPIPEGAVCPIAAVLHPLIPSCKEPCGRCFVVRVAGQELQCRLLVVAPQEDHVLPRRRIQQDAQTAAAAIRHVTQNVQRIIVTEMQHFQQPEVLFIAAVDVADNVSHAAPPLRRQVRLGTCRRWTECRSGEASASSTAHLQAPAPNRDWRLKAPWF